MKPLILVIEDDRATRKALQELFQSEGYPVETAQNGAEGLAAESFDLFAGDWSALPAAFDVVVYAASTGGGGPEAYALAYDIGVRRALGARGTAQSRP